MAFCFPLIYTLLLFTDDKFLCFDFGDKVFIVAAFVLIIVPVINFIVSISINDKSKINNDTYTIIIVISAPVFYFILSVSFGNITAIYNEIVCVFAIAIYILVVVAVAMSRRKKTSEKLENNTEQKRTDNKI
jgi:uncharacterized membrane protein YdjX (TVP38/TMEM64 family)